MPAATANTFLPEQSAEVAAALVTDESYLSALVGRDYEQDLMQGGGRGKTVNVKVPDALVARDRSVDEKTAAIVLDYLVESTVPVTLGTHAYSAVGLTEADISLNLKDFSKQVLKPQADALVESVENVVATLINGVAELNSLGAGAPAAYDAANPLATFIALRKLLRKRGIPSTNLNVVVGASVYADLLTVKAIQDASQSGSTSALREGQVGRVLGMNIVESTRVHDDDIAMFHKATVQLAVRAPLVPQGAVKGATASAGGFPLRHLMDYDADHTQDRSILSTFVGGVIVPLRKITRDTGTAEATVSLVDAIYRVRTSTAPVA